MELLQASNNISILSFRESLAPFWIEWLLLIWLSGLLLGELISPQDKSGLGKIKIVVIVLNLVSHHSLESPLPLTLY